MRRKKPGVATRLDAAEIAPTAPEIELARSAPVASPAPAVWRRPEIVVDRKAEAAAARAIRAAGG